MNKSELLEIYGDFDDKKARHIVKNLLNIIGCVHSNSQKFKIICKGEDLDYRTLQGWYEKTNNINTKGFLKIKNFIKKLGEEDEKDNLRQT